LLELEQQGHRILDLPMEWKEDASSRMRVVVTASKDLKELLRIRWRRFFLGQETGGLGRVDLPKGGRLFNQE